MSQLIIDKIRTSRQTEVRVGGFGFTVRRPTDLEMLEIQQRKSVDNPVTQGEILRRFVVGWSGVNELDLFPGGTGAAVEFSDGLFNEWIVDQPKLWLPLTNAVVESYRSYADAGAEALKNSAPG